MKEYNEERQNILNPFAPNRELPNSPFPSLIAKKPKTTPTKRNHTETRCDIKKLRKIDKRCFQCQRFLKARAVETMPQNSALTKPAAVAIPLLQAATLGTYTQPVTETAPTQPVETTSEQPPKFCAL